MAEGHNEVDVRVQVYKYEESDSAPDYLIKALEVAKGLFEKHHKFGKVKNKTIGAMRARFLDGQGDDHVDIIAISGLGANEWKDPSKIVSFTDQIEKDFKANELHLASVTTDHTELQLINGTEFPTDVDMRDQFQKVFIERMAQKRSRLKDALNESSADDEETKKKIRTSLETSAEYSQYTKEEDFEGYVVKYYFEMLTDDHFYTMQGALTTALRLLFSENPQDECAKQLETDSPELFTRVKEQFDRIKPKDSQEFVDQCCQPENVPKETLTYFSLAFKMEEYVPSTRIANISVQCAEDNAINHLVKIKQLRKAVVSEIEWISVTFSKDSKDQNPFCYKPPCAFCAVGFVPRAKQINNLKK